MAKENTASTTDQVSPVKDVEQNNPAPPAPEVSGVKPEPPVAVDPARVDFEYRKCFRKYPAKATKVKLTAHSMVKALSNAFPSNTATAAYGTIPNADDRTERITEILKSPFL